MTATTFVSVVVIKITLYLSKDSITFPLIIRCNSSKILQVINKNNRRVIKKFMHYQSLSLRLERKSSLSIIT